MSTESTRDDAVPTPLCPECGAVIEKIVYTFRPLALGGSVAHREPCGHPAGEAIFHD